MDKLDVLLIKEKNIPRLLDWLGTRRCPVWVCAEMLRCCFLTGLLVLQSLPLLFDAAGLAVIITPDLVSCDVSVLFKPGLFGGVDAGYLCGEYVEHLL